MSVKISVNLEPLTSYIFSAQEKKGFANLKKMQDTIFAWRIE